jgi:hypothetical protein
MPWHRPNLWWGDYVSTPRPPLKVKVKTAPRQIAKTAIHHGPILWLTTFTGPTSGEGP